MAITTVRGIRQNFLQMASFDKKVPVSLYFKFCHCYLHLQDYSNSITHTSGLFLLFTV